MDAAVSGEQQVLGDRNLPMCPICGNNHLDSHQSVMCLMDHGVWRYDIKTGAQYGVPLMKCCGKLMPKTPAIKKDYANILLHIKSCPKFQQAVVLYHLNGGEWP